MNPCNPFSSLFLIYAGGGFPGTSNAAISFDETASAINEALELHFPEYDADGCKSKVQIIAEPGRYYVSALSIHRIHYFPSPVDEREKWLM